MTAARDPVIDRLRVAALLATIVAHASVPYLTQPVPELLWPVRDSGSVIADVVFWWARCSQPALFFLIAGFVSAQQIAAHGNRRFITARLRRVGVPLLAGIVFILPLVGAVWSLGWIESGRANWQEVHTWRFQDREIRRNLLGPAHLWFLQDLLVITAAYVSLRFIFWRVDTTRARPAIIVSALCLLSIGILAARPDVVFHAPNTFVPDVARLGFGGVFFAAGVSLVSRRYVVEKWTPVIGTCAAALVALSALMTVVPASNASLSSRLALASTTAATVWLSIAAMIGLASRVRVPIGSSGTRLARDSYAIYVMHLPLIGAMHLALLSVPLAPVAKITIAFVVTVVACELVLSGSRYLLPMGSRIRSRMQMIPVRAWVYTIIAIGVVIRLFHYTRNPDVWLDEAALVVNVVDRGYAALLAPLTNLAAAPPLFLWMQRAIATNVGDSTWALRFVPLVSGCVALVAILPLARAVNPRAAWAAVLLMATSVKLLDHSVEAKPYAVDVLLATLAASLFVATQRWSTARRVALFALIAPFLIWISYPAIFVMGGVLVALAIEPYTPSRMHDDGRAISRCGLVPLLLLGVVVVLALSTLLAVSVRVQRTPQILDYWRAAFPSSAGPLVLITWFARALIGIADYCFRPLGAVLLIPIAGGLLALIHERRYALIALLVVPLMLAAIAGITAAYPFSGSRVMLFVLPAFSVLAAHGLVTLMARVSPQAALLRVTIIGVVIAPPIVMCARVVLLPPPRPETAAASAFVLTHRAPSEPVATASWEYHYYLRQLGGSLVRLNEQPLPLACARLWYIVQGDSPEQRRRHAASRVTSAYHIGSAVDFQGVSVFDLRARQ